ncbi:hypothetical protein A2U01_0057928 [Trifolium medium]|uniref:Uncharacterized protein n=1 Tax=Trifolium medium TaxID=97028 RepID=A0A392RMC8_9FABA|nr:hypothetical protein [Trifolium medium]
MPASRKSFCRFSLAEARNPQILGVYVAFSRWSEEPSDVPSLLLAEARDFQMSGRFLSLLLAQRPCQDL